LKVLIGAASASLLIFARYILRKAIRQWIESGQDERMITHEAVDFDCDTDESSERPVAVRHGAEQRQDYQSSSSVAAWPIVTARDPSMRAPSRKARFQIDR
jgi:hypothetical protein